MEVERPRERGACNKISRDELVIEISVFLSSVLQSNPCQHPIVIMRDVSPDDLESLLSFMYKGEVRIEEERLKEFLRTAEMLQVQGLADEQAVSSGRGRAESSSPASPDLRDRRRARDDDEAERVSYKDKDVIV